MTVVAATPLNFTALTSVKPEPAIVMLSPAAPPPGVNDVSFGSTLNDAALSPVPPGVVTPICPVLASAGTAALICEGETIVDGAVDTPPNVTSLAPPRCAPLMVTVVPTGLEAGLKLEIAGGARVTVKSEALAATPPGVVTAIGPVVAPVGTVAVIWIAELTVKLDAVP